jgi:hypothetical protein
MTIKQQGGIFGRNPTFNEVNIEGGLSVDGSSYTNFKENGSTIGSVFVTGDKIGIGTLNNGIAFDQSSNIILPFNPQTLLKRDSELDLGYAAGKFKDLYLSGNVIVDNGKGIDFSATSGTGTSELFDDYEEGTWTPNQGAGLTVSGTFSSAGLYTRIGRQVNVTGKVTGSTNINSSVSGVICTNLPFVVLAASNSVGVMTNTATNNTNMYVNPGTSTAYSSEAAGVSGSLYFSVTYYAT